MTVDEFISTLELYRGRQIGYQDAEGAFFPTTPVLRLVKSGELPERYEGMLLIEGN